ncbi:hypothetical protein GCM10010319_27640 [Streptomyces blastmyceticus]|uniref:Uncharacterized protein n=1 Tax=Streptomyces blastmyceticus TaxID=68180 RepID=A0ABN0WXA1_9ACTN
MAVDGPGDDDTAGTRAVGDDLAQRFVEAGGVIGAERYGHLFLRSDGDPGAQLTQVGEQMAVAAPEMVQAPDRRGAVGHKGGAAPGYPRAISRWRGPRRRGLRR